MAELLDKLSIIYHSTNSEVEASGAEMASQATGTKTNTTINKTNSPLQDTLLQDRTSTTETSILKSMRAQFYSVYGELCMQINSGGTTVIKKT
jgi:hypothetical protein